MTTISELNDHAMSNITQMVTSAHNTPSTKNVFNLVRNIRDILAPTQDQEATQDILDTGNDNIVKCSSRPLSWKDNFLWVPYVLLALFLIIGLGISFIRFHLQNKERYKERIFRRQQFLDEQVRIIQ